MIYFLIFVGIIFPSAQLIRFFVINGLNVTICSNLHVLILRLLAICAQIVTKCEK